MLNKALMQTDLRQFDLLIVENVGNLICPASFELGTALNVLVASVPEGHDKPHKYPSMYRGVDYVILNKIDLLPYVDFDVEFFRKGLEALNPAVEFLLASCRTGRVCLIGMNGYVNKLIDFDPYRLCRLKRNGR